jgi:hypothetical protein
MLLKRRPPAISAQPSELLSGFAHLEPSAIAVLRWLNANKIDYVLVGPVARAIRGESAAEGPVAIVPAPYGRNWERLCTALVAERAGLRAATSVRGPGATLVATPVKLTPDKLSRGRRWLLRCGTHDLDIEGLPLPEAQSGEQAAPSYQELLYEAARFDLAEGISVQVAAPEDLEHYSQVRRTGQAPEFRVIRNAPAEQHTA